MSVRLRLFTAAAKFDGRTEIPKRQVSSRKSQNAPANDASGILFNGVPLRESDDALVIGPAIDLVPSH